MTLSEWLQTSGFKQEALAREMGVSSAAVCHWKTRGIANVEKIARLMSISDGAITLDDLVRERRHAEKIKG